MRKIQISIVAVISFMLLATIALPVSAQTPGIITAEVDRTALSTDEALMLRVIIPGIGSSVSEPVLPLLDGFVITGRSTSSQINIINGSSNSLRVYSYVLTPIKVGELIIGPISAAVNGQIYYTDPIKVTVTQGTGQAPAQPAQPSQPPFPAVPGFPSLAGLLSALGFDEPVQYDEPANQLNPSEIPLELNGQDLFVEAKVDNPAPYMGEQVIHTLRLYRSAHQGGTLYYKEPTFTGFWVHEGEDEVEYAAQAGNRRYLMTEIQTILFPTVIGQVTLEPASLTRPGDVFDREVTANSNPITMDIQPLPENAPTSFNGAVGNFSILAEVDTTETRVNETVTLYITISGEGNLDTLPDPQWDPGSEWRTFESQGTTDVHTLNGTLAGIRSIEQLLVPTQAGDLTIPSIQFSYFDPQVGAYQTISTLPIEITVAPDGRVAAPVNPVTDTPSTSAIESEAQIRPLKPATNRGHFGSLLTQNPAYWMLWGVPLFFLVGQVVWQRRSKRLQNNPGERRSRKAANKAYRALSKLGNEPKGTGRILTAFISDKLDSSVVGLTQTELSDVLLAKGVDQYLVDQVQTCLTLSEMGQYAPAGLSEGEANLPKETRRLISKLEKVL